MVRASYLGDWAREQPERTATVVTPSGERRTYGELDARSCRLAHALHARGVRRGDHVALLMGNRTEMLEAAWAAQRSGLVYTPISTRLSADEVAHIVEDSGAVAVVSEAAYAHLAGTPRVRIGAGGGPPGWEDYEAVLRDVPDTEDPSWVEGVDMPYSSGTTGRPKGVVRPLDGRPLGTPDSATRLAVDWYGLDNTSVFLNPGPLYHAAPLRYTMAQHRLGNPAVVMERFDAERMLALVEEHRVTHVLAVPTMFVRLLALPESVRAAHDLSSLRAVLHGAAPIARHVKQAMIEWLGPILIENYGGTEGNGVTVVDSATWAARPGTVGRPVRGEIHIVGDDGQDLPPGEIGTVWFAGGMPFAYHNDPVKSASAHDGRGRSTLGDVGHVDADGYLYLSDRRSHLIISGGVNIYPREVEDVLSAHPAVADVVVVGVPDEEFGEQVKAVVQPRDGADPGPDLAASLIAFCRARLAHLKCPRSVDFDPELPREPTGKLASRLVKARYWPGPAPAEES